MCSVSTSIIDSSCSILLQGRPGPGSPPVKRCIIRTNTPGRDCFRLRHQWKYEVRSARLDGCGGHLHGLPTSTITADCLNSRGDLDGRLLAVSDDNDASSQHPTKAWIWKLSHSPVGRGPQPWAGSGWVAGKTCRGGGWRASLEVNGVQDQQPTRTY